MFDLDQLEQVSGAGFGEDFVVDRRVNFHQRDRGIEVTADCLEERRVGRGIAAALAEEGIACVVAEQNREIVDMLRKQGMPAVAGNAAEPSVLIQAHIARASMLVIATADTFHVRKMMEVARALNPSIQCAVRTPNDEEAELLRRETQGKVFVGKHELALGMVRHIAEIAGKEKSGAGR